MIARIQAWLERRVAAQGFNETCASLVIGIPVDDIEALGHGGMAHSDLGIRIWWGGALTACALYRERMRWTALRERERVYQAKERRA